MEWIQGLALALGGPGLFVIAFLDSSFLSFPQVVDFLLIWLTTQHPERMPYYALLATLGSVSGCFSLYWVARRGGEAFLRKRLAAHHVERSLRIVRRYGLLSVLVPSLLPPPAPFKIFVIGAGVAGVGARDFLLAVAIGRGLRYFGEGFLALWYGERAVAFLAEHAAPLALVLATVVLVFGGGYVWWSRRTQATPATD